MCVFLFLFCAIAPLAAQEVQLHGLAFENWICDSFFEGYRPPYTGKWDIPAAVNRQHGGIPINPKAVKWGTPVDLGDALRQFDIEEPFWLILGYWQQRGDYKYFVNIFAKRIEPATWKSLWHPITRMDLEKLDAVIKNRELDYGTARWEAKEMKSKPPFSEAVMVLNPKIDSHTQRRLQCSLRFQDVFKYLGEGEKPTTSDTPALWGIPFPNPIESSARSFAIPKVPTVPKKNE